MKERHVGMLCIAGLTYGATMVGFAMGDHMRIDFDSVFCAVINAAVLGGIVWSRR
jgi:hypothetical protein